MKVLIYHSYYGCDTGCCGHRVEIDGESVGFDFMESAGPLDEIKNDPVKLRAAVEKILLEYNPQCLKTIDWSSLQVGEDEAAGAC